MLDRVLVTGGGGFIGTHLARYLRSRGHFVRVVDTKFDDYSDGGHYDEKLQLDLRVWENCLAATKGMDRVYNLAANMGGRGFIAEVGMEVMHDNTLINIHMLEASVHSRVKRYLYSSSACIYPVFKQLEPIIPGLKEEDAYPADPDDFYGWEKLYTEKMCEAYARDRGLDIRIARYHAVYGPEGTYKGGREKSVAALCRKVAEAQDPGSIVIWGDGKQTRSYCYVDDIVRGSFLLMESDYDKPVNIGADRLVTIDELSDIIIKVSGKTITKKYDLTAPQGARGRNADITLAKTVLGWEPKVSLEAGVERTYGWIESRCKADRQALVRTEDSAVVKSA